MKYLILLLLPLQLMASEPSCDQLKQMAKQPEVLFYDCHSQLIIRHCKEGDLLLKCYVQTAKICVEQLKEIISGSKTCKSGIGA